MPFDPNLAGLVVTATDETATAVTVVGELAAPHPGPGWRGHGHRVVSLHDVPHGGRRVVLEIRVRRYKCLATGRIRQAMLPEQAPRHRITRRLETYIEEQWPRRSTADLARETGLDARTVRRITDALAARTLAAHRPLAPVRLGIDECHLGGRARAVLTDLDSGALIDIAEGYGVRDLERLLRRLGQPERVTVVVTDMTPRYHDAVRRVLGPRVALVLDRWHVEKLARDVLDAALVARSKAIKARRTRGTVHTSLRFDRSLFKKPHDALSATDRGHLDVILQGEPKLAALYRATAAFCALMTCRSAAAARTGFAAWEQGLDADTRRRFAPMIRTVRRYEDTIFAFCDQRLTNGRAENLNGRLKDLWRLGRLPRFATFRARALLRFGRAASEAGPADAGPGEAAATTPARRVPPRRRAPVAADEPAQLPLFGRKA